MLTVATQISSYLDNGAVPANAQYLPVPPGKVVRKRGFWLHPGYRMHHTAVLFLISTDVYAMNADDFYERRDQFYCYLSHKAGTAYIGRVEQAGESQQLLHPLMPDLHEPLDVQLDGLTYVGHVISAI
ncbi:hypothetical protein [Pseudomonas knackmussii]|uniref:hypothetical protein n=1 Tax=Pseudomonas knackmussii TaxID=65741 RepID=UPI001F578756|nr:hypothetical protein [Pseudomonas knackmussii]